MKKIILSLIFIALSSSVNAQSVVDRQTIKDNSSVLTPFIDEDINLLSTNFNTISELQLKQLQRLIHHKYAALSTDMEGDELENYINEVKDNMLEILGTTLYTQISQNQVIFDRITGQLYIPVNES